MNNTSPIGDMALSGIRVVDFGQGAIVPVMTSYLADFGAEVIKVESYKNMDFARRIDLFVDDTRDPNRQAAFARYNQNKLSALINLKKPKGVELAKRLVAVADVVTENFTMGVMHRLGLDYEELRKVKPDVIMLSASFGGQTGPYRNFRGQGYIIAALAGLDDITGWPDRWPVSPGTAFSDHYLPYLWATIVLAALEHRSRTGKGQFIDGSSFEGCLDILDTAIADYDTNKRILTRRGNRHPATAPHGVYKCQGNDRWCAIAVFGDEEWHTFCGVVGNPPWTSEEKFSTLLKRLENADELDELVGKWTLEQTAEGVAAKLRGAGLAAEVVKNIEDAHSDPQLIHRGHFWEPQDDPGLAPFTFEAPAGVLSKTPARFQRRFPFLGEHNGNVFFDILHMESDEYVRLVEEEVVF